MRNALAVLRNGVHNIRGMYIGMWKGNRTLISVGVKCWLMVRNTSTHILLTRQNKDNQCHYRAPFFDLAGIKVWPFRLGGTLRDHVAPCGNA
jgi:hypothetical protein